MNSAREALKQQIKTEVMNDPYYLEQQRYILRDEVLREINDELYDRRPPYNLNASYRNPNLNVSYHNPYNAGIHYRSSNTNPYLNTDYRSPYFSGSYNNNPYLSHSYNSNLYNGNYGHSSTYYQPYDRAIIDSIKSELRAEMVEERAEDLAKMAGYGHIVSDRNINNMINQRYQAIEDVRGQVIKELEAIRKMERQRATTDPRVREIADAIVVQAGNQGVPLDQVIQNIKMNPPNVGMWQRITNVLNQGQRKGFLWGVVAALATYYLVPSARKNIHSVAVRSMEEGMDLMDKARSFMGKDHEDFEPDIDEPVGPPDSNNGQPLTNFNPDFPSKH